MATWGSAFVVALKILLMSIVWYIIGVIMIVTGFAFMGTALQSLITSIMMGSPYGAPQIDFSGLIAGFVLLVIGFVITALGSIATFLKYSAEYYAREISRVSLVPPPP